MNERERALEALCRRFDVVILYAFGSRGKEALAWLEGRLDELAPGSSDLDIGVKLRPSRRLSAAEKVELTLALEDLFGVGRVDLVVLDEADPFLAANVIRGERLYADDEGAADEYDLYVLRRAGDLAFLERKRQALVLGEGGPS